MGLSPGFTNYGLRLVSATIDKVISSTHGSKSFVVIYSKKLTPNVFMKPTSRSSSVLKKTYHTKKYIR